MVIRPHRRHPQRLQRDDDDSTVVIGGVTLTGPITITVVSTVTAKTSTSKSTSTTKSRSSSSSTAISRTTASTPISTLLSTTSSSTTSLPPSTTALTFDVSSTSSETTTSALPSISSSAGVTPNTALRQSNGISAGAVIGIVVGIGVLIAIFLFIVLYRKRMQRNRRVNLEKKWSFSQPVMTTPWMNAPGPSGFSTNPVVSDTPINTQSQNRGQAADFSVNSFGPQYSSRGLTVQVPNPTSPSPSIVMPASSFNNEVSSDLPYTTGPSTPSPGLLYSPGTSSRSPYSTTVNFTFIPSYPDELIIRFGESLKVLAEYDDGWALCVKPNGDQGMVPLECLTNSGVPGASPGIGTLLAVPMTNGERRGSARMSSLDSRAQALRDFRTP